MDRRRITKNKSTKGEVGKSFLKEFFQDKSSLWTSIGLGFLSLLFTCTPFGLKIFKWKLLLKLYIKVSLYVILVPLVSFFIIFGNVFEKIQNKWLLSREKRKHDLI